MKQKVTIFICIFLLATGCGQDQTSTQISDITNNETRTLLQIYEEESLVDFVDYLSQCGISYSQFVLGEVDVNTVYAPLKITREGKTVVTLGVYGPLGISCEDATQAFNRISGEYYVEVISYDSAQDLNLALAANKGPDLLNVSGFPVRSYAKQGLFMDLSGLIRDKNEYFDNILELMNYDGQLISVITSYTLDAMAVDASYVQDCEAFAFLAHWSISDRVRGCPSMAVDSGSVADSSLVPSVTAVGDSATESSLSASTAGIRPITTATTNRRDRRR